VSSTPSRQYHILNKVLKNLDNKSDADRAVLICAYAYSVESISERNLDVLLKYADISLQNTTNARIIHFLIYQNIINVVDNGLGILSRLSGIEPNENYNDGAKEFALKEMNRIGGLLSDG